MNTHGRQSEICSKGFVRQGRAGATSFANERSRRGRRKPVRHRRTAFTLIELLVVVAIIGILAALFFPAIHKALTQGRATKAGNIARQIHLGVFTASMAMEHYGTTVWPTSGGADTNGFATSTEWLRDIVANQVVEEGVSLDEFDFRFFHVHGLPGARHHSAFNDAHNAWCVVLDAGEPGVSGSAPFLFTRNIVLEDNHTGSVPTLDRNRSPFGNRLAVVMTVGGALQIIPGELFDTTHPRYDADRLMDAFNPSRRSLPVLYP